MLEGYGIVNGKGLDFDQAQNDLIKNMLVRMREGWTPIGGICYFGMAKIDDYPNYVFCQAIVKPSDVSEEGK